MSLEVTRSVAGGVRMCAASFRLASSGAAPASFSRALRAGGAGVEHVVRFTDCVSARALPGHRPCRVRHQVEAAPQANGGSGAGRVGRPAHALQPSGEKVVHVAAAARAMRARPASSARACWPAAALMVASVSRIAACMATYVSVSRQASPSGLVDPLERFVVLADGGMGEGDGASRLRPPSRGRRGCN